MQIKPISELTKHCDEIIEEVLFSREPAIFTKDGYGQLILMSLHEYEEKMQELQIWAMLKESEMHEKDMKYYTAEQVFDELETFLQGE